MMLDCRPVSRRVLGLTKEPRQRRHKEGTAGTTAHSRMMYFFLKIPQFTPGHDRLFYLRGRAQLPRRGIPTCARPNIQPSRAATTGTNAAHSQWFLISAEPWEDAASSASSIVCLNFPPGLVIRRPLWGQQGIFAAFERWIWL